MWINNKQFFLNITVSEVRNAKQMICYSEGCLLVRLFSKLRHLTEAENNFKKIIEPWKGNLKNYKKQDSNHSVFDEISFPGANASFLVSRENEQMECQKPCNYQIQTLAPHFSSKSSKFAPITVWCL